jgi:hypothetical protein
MEHDETTGEGDYARLGAHLAEVAEVWAERQGIANNATFVLDVEFKKVDGGVFVPADGLVVKQVRNFPQPSTNAIVPVVALPQSSTSLCPLEGEGSDVFALHRAKSRLRFGVSGRVLDEIGLDDPLFEALDAQFAEDGVVVDVDSAFSALDGSRYAVAQEEMVHAFRRGDRVLSVSLQNFAPQAITQAPFRTVEELLPTLTTTFDASVPFYGFDDSGAYGVGQRREELVSLALCTLDGDAPVTDVPASWQVTSGDGEISVDANFFRAPPPSGFSAGFTASTTRWGTTTISGLIAQDIVLTSAWSQTSRPEHHNFGYQFAFEPRLEPGIATDVLDALEEADIAVLFVHNEVFFALGFDGALRPIGQR